MALVALILLIVYGIHCQASFESLYQKWRRICEVPGNNIVLPPRGPGLAKSWSVGGTTVHDVFERNYTGYCSNSHELALSIAQPVREHGCGIEWFDSDNLCALLHKFSRIYMAGDSLTRHIMNALHMVLSGDFQYGAFPNVGKSKQRPLDSRCSCDGQFAATYNCRNYSWAFSFDDVRQLGHCSKYMPERPFGMAGEGDYGYGYRRSMADLCTPNDTRPKLLYLSGGSHYKNNAQHYWNVTLKRQLSHIEYIARNCISKPKYFVVFSGVTASSTELAKQYPFQNDSSAIRFNQEVARYLISGYPETIILNFWNLSKEIMLQDSTADGLHQLTDSNLIKLMTILNAAKLLLKEN